MRLIGMLGSPYVRRVAVSLTAMEVAFVHESVSVFRDYDQFRTINPVVKAPTLVADDGTVLMDSSLILEFVDRIEPERRLPVPAEREDYGRHQRVLGLALAACDKTVQLLYEFDRPPERQHAPWIERVRAQIRAAYEQLEAEISDPESWLFGDRLTQADISAVIAWSFTQRKLPADVPAVDHPRLSRFSRRGETRPEFLAHPDQ